MAGSAVAGSAVAGPRGGGAQLSHTAPIYMGSNAPSRLTQDPTHQTLRWNKGLEEQSPFQVSRQRD